jgi:predicted metal-binding membrane protein
MSANASVLRSPLEAVLKRDRAVVLAGLATLTAVSWAYLFLDAWRMQHGGGCCIAMPDVHSWTALDLTLLFVMWAVMMVGMMVPSVAPMVLTFALVNRKRREREQPFVPTSAFLLGYLVVWTVFSALATLAQWGLHIAALLSPMMVSTSPIFGGALLIAAGVFQWTPMKNTCLTHCRSPLTFLMTDWREGVRGAFVMGLRHGTFCLVCCWFLMTLLFVTGVMNLVWVAIITAFVLLEKVAPAARWTSRIAGAALVAWGVWVIAAAL